MAQALTLDGAQNKHVRRYLRVRHNYIIDSPYSPPYSTKD